MAVKAATCACGIVMRARSSALVGAAPAMVAWCLVVATMVATGGRYWKLFCATNLLEGDTLE